MNIDLNAMMNSLVQTGMQLGLKILAAIALWIVGKLVIGIVLNTAGRALSRQRLDPTVLSYVRTSLSVAMKIGLLLAVLSLFGVETASFAAVLAAAGVAIGMAWSGLLSNFAAGVFLILLRPFKVGDFVTAGGVTGTVKALGLFGTSIDTPDNVQTTVGNAKILGDTIQNFTANPHRRVDMKAQLAHGVDPQEAIGLLQEGLRRIPNVMVTPAPECEILEHTPVGPLLAVRPYTHNDNYWQVYFDTNLMIQRIFKAAGYPVPQQPVVVSGNMQSFRAGA